MTVNPTAHARRTLCRSPEQSCRMVPNVIPFYATALALFFFALSVRTLRLRRDLRIGIGDAGNETMLRAIRVHANFAE